MPRLTAAAVRAAKHPGSHDRPIRIADGARAELFEGHRPMMAAWAKFVTDGASEAGEVHELAEARARRRSA